jgi:hypothetical protein
VRAVRSWPRRGASLSTYCLAQGGAHGRLGRRVEGRVHRAPARQHVLRDAPCVGKVGGHACTQIDRQTDHDGGARGELHAHGSHQRLRQRGGPGQRMGRVVHNARLGQRLPTQR